MVNGSNASYGENTSHCLDFLNRSNRSNGFKKHIGRYIHIDKLMI